jgi:hypothetical protein
MKMTPFSPFRTVSPESALGYQRAAKCERPGCDKSTKHHKPFCSQHVDEQPYVSRLLGLLAETQREHEAVRRRGWKAVSLDGVTASEVLSQLYQYGGRTVERLSRDLQLPVSVIQSYADALAKAGLVGLGRSARKNVLLQPTRKRLPKPRTEQRVSDSAA